LKLQTDRPGSFSAVTEALAGAGLNIEGVTEVGGEVHLLVPDGARAKQVLEAAGLHVDSESDPVIVKLQDRPGELAGVTRRLAGAGVDVRVVYLATDTRVVLVVDDPEKARDEVC
jgi:hypothetical protein